MYQDFVIRLNFSSGKKYHNLILFAKPDKKKTYKPVTLSPKFRIYYAEITAKSKSQNVGGLPNFELCAGV